MIVPAASAWNTTETTSLPFRVEGEALLLLLEQCGEATAVLDDTLHFQYVNTSATRLLEKRREELVGFPLESQFPELSHALATNGPSQFAVYEHHASLSKRLHTRCLSLRESGTILFFQDVSEESQSQNSLEEALRFRERLLETVSDVLYLHDLPERQTTYLNGQLDIMLGYDKTQLTALNYAERRSLLYHPDDFATLKAAAERYRSLADNETMETEYRVRSADGEWRWLCSRESVFSRNSDGLPTRILGIARDVTDQHHILELSETSRARYRTLVTLLSDWIFETDTSGVYTYVSRQVVTLLGYDPSEMIGKRSTDFMPPEEAARTGPILRRIAATQAAFTQQESAYRTKSGELIFHESSGTPIYDRGGNWIGYRGVERNITERKRYEAMLAAAAEKQGHIAETLQRSLLLTPDQTAFTNIEVITRYEPASEEALVGGDFFDAFRLEEGKIAFIVGDVTGKGLAAATDTAEIKFLLRSYLRESTLQTAFARLNRQILLRRHLDNHAPDVFVCLTAAVLDTKDGTVRFAVAGMEPPLILRAQTEGDSFQVETVMQGGLPLGTMLNIPEEEAIAYRLTRGDFLLLYSDGVTEARSGSLPDSAPPEARFFGVDRLTTAITQAAHQASVHSLSHPTTFIGDSLLDAVHRFSGSDQRDDLCLLLARYTPESSVPEDSQFVIPLPPEEHLAPLTRQLEEAIREREVALKEADASREWQRRFLTEVLANVTEGRLRLCHQTEDLPLPMSSRPLSTPLVSSESLYSLRRQIESLAEEVGLPTIRTQELLMAVGEAAMNSIVHAGGGVAIVTGDAETHRLQIRVTDTGGGIAADTLHRATLERGFTTAGSLGFGFSMMYAAADRVYLLTGPTGTTVILEQDPIPPISY